jgi:hypothetical protein
MIIIRAASFSSDFSPQRTQRIAEEREELKEQASDLESQIEDLRFEDFRFSFCLPLRPSMLALR